MSTGGSPGQRERRLASIEAAAKHQGTDVSVVIYDPRVGPPAIPPGSQVVIFLPSNGREVGPRIQALGPEKRS